MTALNLPEARSARAVPWWFGSLLVLALWLVARPYAGLRHDGILYLGQALLHLRPEVMSADLFFAFGSQDRFTVFSRLLAWMYTVWDVPLVQVGVLAACQILLLWAAWHLLRPLPGLERWLGLCALAVVSHQYGGHGIFAFAERFVTARSLAEPLVLLALWALVSRRRLVALALVLAAALVHPLVAIGGLAVGWCWLVAGNRRWAWALALVAVPLALGAAGVAPFDQLLSRYDDAWWAKLTLASGHLLIRTWHHTDYWSIALDFGALALAARWIGAPLRRLAIAVIAAGAALLLVSLLAGDLGRNALLTQLQLWRVLWIAHLLAIAALPALVLHAWRQADLGRVLALVLASTAVAVYSRWPAGWAFLLMSGGALVLMQRPQAASAGLRRLLLAASWLLVAGLTLAVLASNLDQVTAANRNAMHPQYALLLATVPSLALPFAGAVLRWREKGHAATVAAAALLSALLAYGAMHWDRRPLMVRVVENGLHADHPFRDRMPPGAQVYWWKQPAAAWVLLQRPSWWSADQSAGLPFNRATGFESERRRNILGALDMQEQVCRMTAQLNGGDGEDLTSCMPTPEVLARVCRADRGPDFLIFERRLDRATAQWVVNPGNDKPLTWYLYDCVDFR